MGLFDFIKGGVREMMIARPDDKKDLLVWKHPDPTIPMYSQLTVDADEAAVFFRDGSIVGVLRSAGVGQRHTLDSQNLPFLSNVVDKFTGGNVFTTELYFVTMRPLYDAPFGGELAPIEDPQLGEMITPRIYGTFSFQVVDPAVFLLQYVGLTQSSSNEHVLGWIKGLLLNGIRAVMGQVLIDQEVSMLKLMALQQTLAQRFAEAAPDLQKMGCKVLQLGQFSVNLSDEDKARLQNAQAEIGAAKRKARVANIGIATAAAEAQQRQFELDQKFQQDARYVQQLTGNYMTYATGQALVGAGQGMAHGGAEGPAGAAASLGVGFAMANQLAHGLAGAAGAPVAVPQGAAAAGAPGAAMVSCPSCKKQVSPGKFCAECGSSLAPKKRFCSACGSEGAPGARFCSGCGSAFAQEA